MNRQLNPPHLITIASIVTAALLLGANSFAQESGNRDYTILDLGTLGGSFSLADGINERGDVVGTAETDKGEAHGFLYSDGIMRDLGTLGGRGSMSRAINPRGDVVGQAEKSGPDLTGAFVYSQGQMFEIPGLGGTYAEALGINERGDIVGGARTGSGNASLRAFLFRSGNTYDLGVLPGDRTSFAAKINARGDIVGISTSAINEIHGFIYQQGVMSSLGDLGGGDTIAEDINANAEVVGYSRLGNLEIHAFLFRDGQLVDLGTLGGPSSRANALNDRGDIVGSSAVDSSARRHAFLVSNGAMVDLNDLITPNSGWTLEETLDINNKGQIVGYGRTLSGQQHGFLLNPR